MLKFSILLSQQGPARKPEAYGAGSHYLHLMKCQLLYSIYINSANHSSSKLNAKMPDACKILRLEKHISCLVFVHLIYRIYCKVEIFLVVELNSKSLFHW